MQHLETQTKLAQATKLLEQCGVVIPKLRQQIEDLKAEGARNKDAQRVLLALREKNREDKAGIDQVLAAKDAELHYRDQVISQLADTANKNYKKLSRIPRWVRWLFNAS